MDLFQAISELTSHNKAGALCTVVRSSGSTPRQAGAKMLVYADGSTLGSVGGGDLENRVVQAANAAIKDEIPVYLEYDMGDTAKGDPRICGGHMEVFVDPLQPKAILLVIGAGHVGKAVAQLAHWLGFRVVINDDRPEFCTPENVPDADEFIPGSISDLPELYELNQNCYLVLTTRGAEIDIEGLPALLQSQAAFIGVIGSRTRWTAARNGLIQKGIPQEKIDRVRSPMGLEINAETPEEIALSIMSEIIMIRRGGDGGVMSKDLKK